MATSASPSAGDLLRTWRQRRRLTQLELSLRAQVSARHLSFVETGRSAPSRHMLLHLAEHHLLQAPINVLRATLHPEGLAPRILNLAEWRAHLNFLSTVATFGTAVDVTLADLSIESFFPADDQRRTLLQQLQSP